MKKLSSVFAAGIIVAVASTVAAADTLKLASFVPPVYVLHDPIFENLAAELAAATNGSTKIEIYPSGELGAGPVEQYKRAATRVAEIAYGLPGYSSSIFPKTLLIEMPGVTNSSEDATSKLWKVMDEYLRDEFKRTIPLALFVTPPAVLMMRDKPVRKLEDLKGLKIRVSSSSAATAIEAYGGTPVSMPANKVYTAIDTGMVDGALMGTDALLIFKLIEITNYVTTNLPPMPTTVFLVANEEALNELSDADRAALDSLTGLELSQRATKCLVDFGELAMSKFANKAGAEIITLTEAEREAFDKRAETAVETLTREYEAQGVPAGEILAAMEE